MLVYINGFWPGFHECTDGVHWGFFQAILEGALHCKLHLTRTIELADILLESHFGPSVFEQKAWRYSFFFSGEGVHSLPPLISSYTACMGAVNSGRNFVACPLYLAYDYCRPVTYPRPTEVPAKGICSIISSQVPGSYRYKLLEDLSKELAIDNAGRYKNTLGYTIPGSYSDQPIIDFQKTYKLVLAFENSVVDDYITEKILNAFRAGTIPVYFGSKEICKYFNAKRFIQVKDSLQETVDEIKKLLTDSTYWLEKASEPIFVKSTAVIMQDIIQSLQKLL
jgi:hypothetical protein